jgi:hypothetical protein
MAPKDGLSDVSGKWPEADTGRASSTKLGVGIGERIGVRVVHFDELYRSSEIPLD